MTIAYIAPEIALPGLVYSGGLGYLAHSYGLSSKSFGLDAVIISVLYRQSFDQIIENGKMRIEYAPRSYDNSMLENTGIVFPLKINGKENFIKVWRLSGHDDVVPIYLLDADLAENDALGRLNTLQLYGGSIESGANLERWIAYAIILGEGSVEALKQLDIPVSTYHLNESYLAFAAMKIADPAKVVFTTHTPVPSGNKKFDLGAVHKMLGNRYPMEYLKELGGDPFDMAAACIKLSRKVNAVSKKHLDTIEKMWGWLDNRPPFVAITNGVRKEYWQYPEFASAKTPSELAATKKIHKRKLIDFVKEKTGVCLSENISTLVWARRIAAYKRPTLLFFDKAWVRNLLCSNSLQIIISGKPHPDDKPMVDEFNYILKLSRELPNLVVLANYDMEQSKILKGGADIWLNNPRAPMEASGTSGMSAALNGTLNLSTPDGWMAEANPENCFLFGSSYSLGNMHDAFDAKELRTKLSQVLAMFRKDKDTLNKKTLAAKIEAEEHWTSDRMVEEYKSLLYEM